MSSSAYPTTNVTSTTTAITTLDPPVDDNNNSLTALLDRLSSLIGWVLCPSLLHSFPLLPLIPSRLPLHYLNPLFSLIAPWNPTRSLTVPFRAPPLGHYSSCGTSPTEHASEFRKSAFWRIWHGILSPWRRLGMHTGRCC